MFGRKKKYERVFGVVGDLHCGSRYFVFPDNLSGFSINDGQKRLLRYWRHMCKQAKKEKIDELLVVGDCFAGTNYRNRGVGLMCNLIDDQRLAAETLLRMLIDAVKDRPKVRVWSGTPYHESVDTKAHLKLAETLDAEYVGGYGLVTLYDRDGIKKTAFVAHEASNALVYPETPIARDIREFKVAYADGKSPKIDLIVRAHKHMNVELEKGSIKAVQVPCWGTFYPYKQSIRNFPMWQTDIGGVFIYIQKDSRIKPQEWVYPPFTIKVTRDKTGVGCKIIEGKYDPVKFVEGW